MRTRDMTYAMLFALVLTTSARPAQAWTTDTPLSGADASFLGEAEDDQAGYGLAGAGDLDGDGLDDLVIAAHLNDEAAADAGQVYLVFGRISGWSMDVDLSAADASYLGSWELDQAGTSVAGVGDVDGDGYDDLLIGAPYNDDAGTSAGQAYLVMGQDVGWAMDVDLGLADASFLGEADDDQAGFQVAAAGDVDGDGYDDLLICAAGHDAGGYAGLTYLVLGQAAGFVPGTSLSAADASFEGEAGLDYSGSALASAGDVDGDGYDEILVGAYGNDAAGNSAGQTYLVLGRASR